MAIGTYLQPASYEELGKALAEMTPDSRVIAGGTDLMIEIREKHPDIPVLVSLIKVPELKGISIEDGHLRIGSMVCHAEAAASCEVREYAGALAMSCSRVGSTQIRNRGTIGGSLGNASAAGDILPVLCLLHACIKAAGPHGAERLIAAEDFQKGAGRTALDEREIVKEILIPLKPERKSVFVKLGGRSEVTIAEISLCLSWEIKDGRPAAVEGVLGAVDVRPLLLPEVDDILGRGTVGDRECTLLYEILSEKIKQIRMRRKRPPKLRIREGEREYKELAVKGVIYDAVSLMSGL